MFTGSPENHSDVCWQLCKCSECGVEAVCTPMFDFYTWSEGGAGELLVCERCLTAGTKGTIVIGSPPVLDVAAN